MRNGIDITIAGVKFPAVYECFRALCMTREELLALGRSIRCHCRKSMIGSRTTGRGIRNLATMDSQAARSIPWGYRESRYRCLRGTHFPELKQFRQAGR